MTKTQSFDALLTVCIQDLHAGEAMLAEALPKIARHANDPQLRKLLDRTTAHAVEASGRLAETGRHCGGAKNLWMDGILSDARRDTRSIEAGPLLDAAMIGAIRKAKAAQIVSYDTAVAVARALDRADVAEPCDAIRKQAQSISRSLAQRLPKPAR